MANTIAFHYVDSAKAKSIDKAVQVVDALKDVSVLAYDDEEIRGVINDVSSFAHNIHIPENVSELSNDTGYLVSNDVSNLVSKDELESKNYLQEHQSLEDYAKTIDVNTSINNTKIEIEGDIDDLNRALSSRINDVSVNTDVKFGNTENLIDQKIDALNTELSGTISTNKTTAENNLAYAIERVRADYDASIANLDNRKQNNLTAGAGIDITDNVISSTIDTTLFLIVDELPVNNIDNNKIYLIPTPTSAAGNIYTEHIHTNGGWETLGQFKADTDLSGYYRKNEVDALISDSSVRINTKLSNAVADLTIIDTSLGNQINALNTKVDNNVATLTNNITTNSDNIATNTSNITNLQNTVTDNTSAIGSINESIATLDTREANDIQRLGGLINDNALSITRHENSINGLNTDLANEAEARENADASIYSTIEDKIGVIENSIEQIKADIDASIEANGAAIETEAEARANADASINEELALKINAEDAVTKVAFDASVADLSESIEALIAKDGDVDSSITDIKTTIDNIDASIVAIDTSVAAIDGVIEDKLNPIELTVNEHDASIDAFDASIVAHDSSIKDNKALLVAQAGIIDDILDEITNLKNGVSGIPKFAYAVVDTLPDPADASAATIYLKRAVDEPGDMYTEYLAVDGVWEQLGHQEFNIADYATDASVADHFNAIDNIYVKIADQSTVDASLETAINDVKNDVSIFRNDVSSFMNDVSTFGTLSDTVARHDENLVTAFDKDNEIDSSIRDINHRIDVTDSSLDTLTQVVNGFDASIVAFSTLEEKVWNIDQDHFETRIVNSNNSTAKIWNESDGGGIMLITEDEKRGFVGVHDGSDGSDVFAQMYAIDKTNDTVGPRITLKSDKAYYTKEKGNFLPGNEIAIKSDIPDMEYVATNEYVSERIGNLGYKEEEYNTFDYIYDETSWNESVANGAMKMYYEKYPEEDLYNEAENRAATFNDRQYAANIYSDAEGTTLVDTADFKAGWVSTTVQKITNLSDNSVFYIAKDAAADETVYEMFTDNEMTTSANQYIMITEVSYPGCVHSWQGIVNAPGAKLPWICPYFDYDANAQIKFLYKGKESVMPWGDKVFGTGEGHKSYGWTSVAAEFKDNGFLIPECQNNSDPTWSGTAGDNNFDLSKFKIVLIKLDEVPTVKEYIDAKFRDLLYQLS